MIVLTTTASSLDDVVGEVLDQLAWIDGVELRVDLLEPAERPLLLRLPRLLQERGAGHLPLIGTVRRTRDGGASTDDESTRLDLLSRAVNAGFPFVDLEADLGASDRHSAIVRTAEEGATESGGPRSGGVGSGSGRRCRAVAVRDPEGRRHAHVHRRPPRGRARRAVAWSPRAHRSGYG
ncbi:MAG: type I 3-dehydroquinate dehydratase [Spirochaetota bacterium]